MSRGRGTASSLSGAHGGGSHHRHYQAVTGAQKSRGVRDLEKATDDWEVEDTGPLPVVFEDPFVRDLFDVRAEHFVRDVVARLNNEMSGMRGGIPGGRCGFVVMILGPVIRQQVEWLNIQVGASRQHPHFGEGELYAYIAVLFMSHLTNMSMLATRTLFMEMGMNPPTVPLCEFVSSKLCGCHPLLRNGQTGDGIFAWNARRDQTRCLKDFERNAFAAGKRLFYVPSCQFLTLDD